MKNLKRYHLYLQYDQINFQQNQQEGIDERKVKQMRYAQGTNSKFWLIKTIGWSNHEMFF